MRNSRIMAVLIVLCFTFAGVSTVWADKDFNAKTANKEIKIKTDDNYHKKEIKVKRGDNPEVDVTSIASEAHGSVTGLSLNNEPVQYISDGAVIITGTDTCAWIFSGGTYHRYCW